MGVNVNCGVADVCGSFPLVTVSFCWLVYGQASQYCRLVGSVSLLVQTHSTLIP